MAQLTIQAVGGGVVDLGTVQLDAAIVNLGQIEVLNPSTTLAAPFAALTVGLKDPTTGVYSLSGTALAEARPIEAKINGDAASGWTPIGGDSFLALPEIAPLGSVVVDIRGVPRVGLETVPVDARFFASSGARPAYLDSIPGGVLTGHRLVANSLAYLSAAAAPAGGGDVDLPDAAAWIQGDPATAPAEQITLNDIDGSAVPLPLGESYIALIVVQPLLGWVVVKGDGGPAPADPALAANQLAVYRITKTEATAIDAGDIEQVAEIDGYEYLSAAALSVTVSPGRARAGRVETAHPESAHGIPDDSTTRLWVEPAGSLVLGAVQPFPGAIPLWEIVAAGGVITGQTDLRHYSPPRETVSLVLESVPATVHRALVGRLWPGPISLTMPDWPGDATLGAVTVTVEQLVSAVWETVAVLAAAFDSGGVASAVADPGHLMYYGAQMLRVSATDTTDGSAVGAAVVLLDRVGG